MKKYLYRNLALSLLAVLLLATWGYAGNNTSTQSIEQINKVFNELLCAVNTRDKDRIISLYHEDATIKTSIDGEDVMATRDQYAQLLPQKMEEWDENSVKLLDYEIKEVNEQENDRVEVVVKIKGKRGILTGSFKGSVELVQNKNEWKIISDKL